jgi:antitoxin ParD1/3/4
MNVSLSPQLRKFVADKLKSGRYHSASEVVREGLRLLEERDQARQVQLDEFRNLVAVGVRQAEAGEVVEGDAVFDRLRRRNRAASRKKR